jgi:hypothetical protein
LSLGQLEIEIDLLEPLSPYDLNQPVLSPLLLS